MKTGCRVALIFCWFFVALFPRALWAEETGGMEAVYQQARADGVEEQTLNRMLVVAQRYQIPDETQIEWLDQIRMAARLGIPMAPLVGKIEEGAAKHISADRIQAALHNTRVHLQQASELVDAVLPAGAQLAPADRDQAIVRMADLISTGVSRAEQQGLCKTWKGTPLPQVVDALTFYAVVKQAGLAADDARQIAEAGLVHDHFHGFPIELALMIKSAKANQVDAPTIVEAALGVVEGRQTVAETHRLLNLQPVQVNPVRGQQGAPGGTRGVGPNGKGTTGLGNGSPSSIGSGGSGAGSGGSGGSGGNGGAGGSGGSGGSGGGAGGR